MCAAIDGIEGMGVRTRTGRYAMVMPISPGTVGAMLARHIDAPTMCRHLDRAGKADSGGNIRATIRSKAAQASPCQRAIMAACKRSGPARSPQAICGGGTAARSPDAMLCAGSWETPFKVAATTLRLTGTPRRVTSRGGPNYELIITVHCVSSRLPSKFKARNAAGAHSAALLESVLRGVGRDQGRTIQNTI